MKRSLLPMAAFFLLLFGIATAIRLRRGEEELGASPTERTERIRRFWHAYQQATDARTEGDPGRAAGFFREALAMDPRHEDSLFYLATSLEESGRYRDAADVLRELTTVNPRSGRGWSELGSVLARRAPGNLPDAEGAASAFSRTEEINQEHSGPFLSLGTLALDEGDLSEASRLFRTASDMSSPEGSLLAGLVAFLEGRNGEAVRFFRRVLEASARESAISGRGVASEGDSELGAKLTPLESARIRALFFLYWTVRRSGGYPVDVPASFRLDLPERVALGRTLEARGRAPEEPSAWDRLVFDVDGDGADDAYVVGSGFVGTGRNRLLRNEGGRFVDLTESLGLGGERPTARAVASDFDGDGRNDLVEVGSSLGGVSPVRLFLRRGERFEDAAKAWGLSFDGTAVDAAVSDFDGDGRPDLFVLGWKAPARLFRNRGSSFVDVTEEAGLARVGGDGLSALFFDFDRDGDPDLLVTAHAPLALSLRRLLSPRGRAASLTPRLFRNEGGRRFVEVTSAVGLDHQYGVVEAKAVDVDSDGWSDLVFAMGGLEATHLEPSVVLRNEGGRDFVEWAHVPSSGEPRRALGVSAVEGRGGVDLVLASAGGRPR